MNCAYCKDEIDKDYYISGKAYLPVQVNKKQLGVHNRYKYFSARPTFEEMENRRPYFFCCDTCYTIFMNKLRISTFLPYIFVGIIAIGWSIFMILSIYKIFTKEIDLMSIVLIVFALMSCLVGIFGVIVGYEKLLGYREEKEIFKK